MARTIVITGAGDGIGAAAARRLAAGGEQVVVVGRSPEKTTAQYPEIDVLVNNAGGIFGGRARTADGFEKTLQVNHLAPFLLTNLLLATLLGSRATVINASSVAARLFGRVDVDGLNNDARFSANKAHGDAKLANILFTRGLHRRFHDRDLSAAAFHPGTVATNFASDTTSPMRFIYRGPLKRLVLTSPDKGAETLIWLADGKPGRDWNSGEHYEKKQVAATNDQALDDDLVERLWDRSTAMVGLPDRA